MPISRTSPSWTAALRETPRGGWALPPGIASLPSAASAQECATATPAVAIVEAAPEAQDFTLSTLYGAPGCDVPADSITATIEWGDGTTGAASVAVESGASAS